MKIPFITPISSKLEHSTKQTAAKLTHQIFEKLVWGRNMETQSEITISVIELP